MRNKTPTASSTDLEKFLEDIKLVVRDGQELLKTGMDTMRERARSGADTTARLVRGRPYQSMGLVFGLGVLFGLLAWGTLIRGAKGDKD